MRLFFHLFLLPLVLSLSSAKEIAITNFIRDTCKKTLHNDLCLTTFQSDPNSHKADPKGLVAIVLRIAHAKASMTHDRITGLMVGENNQYMDQCFNDCSEQYLDAIDQIEDSLAALESNGYSDVNTWVTAAMGDAQACEEEFDVVGYRSPLTTNNVEFTKLCSISLAILKLVTGSG
ncbi:hypothetical protein MRB53_004602 [Persea americana]|uniref:Uncharacterized protein n=1 Tax=Persea americana TaxID=3435 RepID=A0ACC2MBY5_PERAE|nr:hypothetical protein MRB53_004602 [Persea americana]